MQVSDGTRLLVVEDNDELRGIISNELSDLGYSVEQACNGEEAMKRLRQEGIELMTLDIKMPKEDGWNVLHFMAEQSLTTRVIVLTAYASISTAVKAKKMGADAFLEKPYDIEELVYTIERVLKNDEAIARV